MTDSTLPPVSTETLAAHHIVTPGMVLVDYLREVGAEFDVNRTALEADTFWDRLALAEYKRVLDLGADPSTLETGIGPGHKYQYYSLLAQDIQKRIADHHELSTSRDLHATFALARLTFYDMDRILDAVANFTDTDAAYLAEIAIVGGTDSFLPSAEADPSLYHLTGDPPTLRVNYPVVQQRFKALAHRLGDIVKESVIITVQPGRDLKYTEGTLEGKTPETRTLKGDVPGNMQLIISEQAIAEEGIRLRPIQRRISKAERTEAWITVENQLTGRHILFKQRHNSNYRVRVQSGTTNYTSLTGAHLKTAGFDLCIEDANAN